MCNHLTHGFLYAFTSFGSDLCWRAKNEAKGRQQVTGGKMRLTCPNCGAQYEVPDEVIPETGRDVQCSNCGDTWFQHHPDHAPLPEDDLPEDTGWDAPEEPEEPQEPAEPETPAEEPEEAPELAEAGGDVLPEEPSDTDTEEAAEAAPARRELSPDLAEVLRQEAERERAARMSDGGDGLETQPELGLTEQDDEAGKRSREAQARMARLRGEDPAAQAPAPDADNGPDPGTRRNLLPDIDEINSSLALDSTESAQAGRDSYEDIVVEKTGGFRRGFLLIVLLAVIGLLVYMFAPQLAQSVPALEQPLASYVELVNAGRVWLNSTIGSLAGNGG